MEQRTWHHSESPEGKPSAASARLGCPCEACDAAYRAYLAAYRERRTGTARHSDGTKVYHTHVGQPSPRSARKYRCTHPRCLYLAGLYLDPYQIVRVRATGQPAPEFLPADASVA